MLYSHVFIYDSKLRNFPPEILDSKLVSILTKIRDSKFKSLKIRDLKIESRNLRFESRNFFCRNPKLKRPFFAKFKSTSSVHFKSFIFLIDVSKSSVRRNIPQYFLGTRKKLLVSSPVNNRLLTGEDKIFIVQISIDQVIDEVK